jgi:hypothetical protein
VFSAERERLLDDPAARALTVGPESLLNPDHKADDGSLAGQTMEDHDGRTKSTGLGEAMSGYTELVSGGKREIFKVA